VIVTRLTDKQAAFIDHYLMCLNATEAASRAGYDGSRESLSVIGSNNLGKVKIREEIDRRLKATTMSADEVLKRLDQQARADIGVFFKIVEEWTFYPLPTQEILDAIEVEDTSNPDKPKTRVSYLVRHVAIDPDKLIDPAYSHLLHKVSDTPRGGLQIELYSKQRALENLGKHYALFTDKVKHEDWRDTALEYIRNDEISYEALKNECGSDLAAELFKLAGKAVTVGARQDGDPKE
jgi:phage terminase small subunit